MLSSRQGFLCGAQQVHARKVPLYDQDVVICVIQLVQQFNYLRNAAALIGHQCQAICSLRLTLV